MLVGWFAVRYVWSRKNVDLVIIFLAVKTFFAERGFREARESKSEKKKRTMLFEARQEGKFRSMKVEVLRRRDGFELNLEADPVMVGDTFTRMGTLSTLFGGGLLVRRKLEGSDPSFYERLESNLVDYVERKMETQGNRSPAHS
jgi:hypothetical protein